MKKKLCALLTAIVCVSALILTGCSSANGTIQVQLDPSNPTTVSIWHYYNGAQQDAFNRLVSEFNDTVGKETGIIVESFSRPPARTSPRSKPSRASPGPPKPTTNGPTA